LLPTSLPSPAGPAASLALELGLFVLDVGSTIGSPTEEEGEDEEEETYEALVTRVASDPCL
jgi:hypothetical protein